MVLHREEPAEHRQDVQQGGPADHLAGADGGGQEHVDQAQRGAGQPRHGGDPVDLVLGQVEADVVEPGSDCAGQEPDGEAEHEGEGGDCQSGPGDLRGPVLRLLGVPPCEDATGGVERGHRAPAVVRGSVCWATAPWTCDCLEMSVEAYWLAPDPMMHVRDRAFAQGTNVRAVQGETDV